MAITKEALALLAKPFHAGAHKYLNGMVYLHEDPITERLDEVDLNWRLDIKSIVTRDNAGKGGKDVGTVTVTITLTVLGVSRDGVGMAVIQQSFPQTIYDKNKKPTDETYTTEANEAEKSATTDALKRAARNFAIGRYILTIGKNNVTNETQMKEWLAKNYPDVKEGKTYHDDSAAPASEETPNPLELDTHLGKQGESVPDKKWFETVFKLTKPFYTEVKHQENSLNKAWNTKLIHGAMLPRLAAITMLLHRIEEDVKLSPDEAKSLVISALGGGVNDWMTKNKDNFAKAWEMVQNYIAQASQQQIPF